MSRVTLKKASFGAYDVLGWDEHLGEDDCYLGQVVKADDFYWFEPLEGAAHLMSCRTMMDIGYELARLNTERA